MYVVPDLLGHSIVLGVVLTGAVIMFIILVVESCRKVCVKLGRLLPSFKPHHGGIDRLHWIPILEIPILRF